jgi:hypothetical protein
MSSTNISQSADAIRVEFDDSRSSHAELHIRQHYDTAKDLAPPSWLYFDCADDDLEHAAAEYREETVFAYLNFEAPACAELVIEMNSSEATGSWSANPWTSGPTGSVSPRIAIPVVELEQWENMIHLRGTQIEVADVYIAVPVNSTGDAPVEIRPRHRPWHAAIELVEDGKVMWKEDAELVGSVRVGSSVISGRQAAPRENAENLGMVVSAILAAQVTDSDSPFRGGFHLVYDRVAASYRVPHWIWAWGPAMRLLLEASQYLPDSQHLNEAAHAAGQTSLGFFIDDPKHMAHDISTVRWYAALGTPAGAIQYASLADSLFMAGWGWIPLYRATGDQRYVEATWRLVNKADRLLQQYAIPPQDYVFECENWTPHTLDESGFGMVGFEELFAVTSESRVREIGTLFMDRHLDAMLADGPMWHRIRMREDGKKLGEPDVKGHAWIMDAYLSAYGLTGDQRYLSLAVDLAKRTIASQAPNGSWTIGYHTPGPNDLEDDKANAIWAYQLYRLHRLTNNQQHLESAQQALTWCNRHLETRPGEQGYGSMVNPKPMAHIKKRDMAILYSTTYHGLALIEQMRLDRA